MANLPIIIGLDLGTTRCKATAFDLMGCNLANITAEITTYRPQKGWYEQEPEDWIHATESVLNELTKVLGGSTKNIRCIGISAHGPSLVPVNSNFHPLTRAITWQDVRSHNYAKKMIEKAGTNWIGVGLPMSGIPAKLAWMLNEMPEISSEATYFLSTKSYLVSHLTGQVLDEPSSSSVLERWDEKVFDYLGIALDRMPKIVSPETVVGPMRKELSESLGLPRDTQIVIGLNDGASACLGVGILEDGESSISLGTNGVVRFVLSHPYPGDKLLENSMFCYPYIRGKYIMGGYTKSGGDSIGWLFSILANGHEENRIRDDFYSEAGKFSPPGSRGIIFIPYLSGRGTPDASDSPCAAFVGLGRHHSRPDITRSVLEGVAFSLREITEHLHNYGLNQTELRIEGGGAKNPTWRHILANVLGSPLMYYQQGSTLGAAIIAAVCTGLFHSYHEAKNVMVKNAELIDIDPSTFKEYNKQFETYRIYVEKIITANGI